MTRSRRRNMPLPVRTQLATNQFSSTYLLLSRIPRLRLPSQMGAEERVHTVNGRFPRARFRECGARTWWGWLLLDVWILVP